MPKCPIFSSILSTIIPLIFWKSVHGTCLPDMRKYQKCQWTRIDDVRFASFLMSVMFTCCVLIPQQQVSISQPALIILWPADKVPCLLCYLLSVWSTTQQGLTGHYDHTVHNLSYYPSTLCWQERGFSSWSLGWQNVGCLAAMTQVTEYCFGQLVIRFCPHYDTYIWLGKVSNICLSNKIK